MLERERADPGIAHEIACSGSTLEQVDEEPPMPRSGRQHQGIGRRPQHLHELQCRCGRRGGREDARMGEHAQHAAQHRVAERERLGRCAQRLERGAHDRVPRCVAAHRADQHVHIDEDQSSGAVHDVEQRSVIGEVDTGTQTLPAVDGQRLAHSGGRFDALHLVA